jgi:type VI secretion system protein ImpF
MSGRLSASQKAATIRFSAPLLDRLIDLSPDQSRDPPASASDSLIALRNAVRRDLEALLNARRCWRSWPETLTELAVSPLGYGVPDFTAGALNDARMREELRLEIEDTIRRFEPRFLKVDVALVQAETPLESTLRLRINAVLHAEPAPEPMTFDTVVDPSNDEIIVVARDVD